VKLLLGFAGATLASVIAAGSASAADLGGPPPAPPAYRDDYMPALWSGFYIGAFVGGADVQDRVHDVDDLNGGARFHVDSGSFLGGGTAGYNWQTGSVVVGVETDVGGMSVKKWRYDPNFIGGTFDGIDSGVIGDVSGRLGFAVGRALIYAKGGFAYFDGDAFVDNHLGGFGGGRAFTNGFTGWDLGGGVEYKFDRSWSAKVEYLHYDFGTDDATLHTPFNGNFRYSNALTADAVTVGLSYHFGARDYAPLK
jgi:outer membrane immunogenic protein